jgi:hypothetical protein
MSGSEPETRAPDKKALCPPMRDTAPFLLRFDVTGRLVRERRSAFQNR